jgi:peptidoglycan/xylan/chitin deacetylase (PgdA/CDA1 family)
MSLPKDYLTYPNRNEGMDHDLYPYSNMFERPPVAWPRKRPIALWITIALEYFPLAPKDTPVRAPGAMVTPYPDYRTYTAREYGNRVGIFRILKILDALKLKASFPTSAAIATRYPFLLNEITKRGHEIVGHGDDMNAVSYGGMSKEVESQSIQKSLRILRKASKQRVTGWVSPARSESEHTLELLIKNGIEYAGDWVNDDMPYSMNTPSGSIIAMPHTMELEDRHLLITLGQNEKTYQRQIINAFDLLLSESKKYGGRVLHLSLTPYVIGQAWRIQTLLETLQIMKQTDAIWSATGQDIAQHWQEQQT